MDTYRPPIERMLRALSVAGIGDVLSMPKYAGIDIDAVRDVLEGFGRLAADVIAPTDRIGDVEGAVLDATGSVHVPEAFHTAFAEYVKGGWTNLEGFPGAVSAATQEMFNSANMALALNPILTQSAIELLRHSGDERQQRIYLSRLVDGTWTGTMNLTEPDAGSDVGAVRATAEPLEDGRWAISGTKIYITWGEHDLTENIVHLVLARAPGGGPGTRGLSLFLVPKVLVDDHAMLIEPNQVECLSIEHKMGIKASPTCVLQFDGAIGELVGPVHGGMAGMFLMMNAARLSVGLQGVAVTERAYQQAFAFAHDRVQGGVPIIEHPDVRRMLLSIATVIDAARLLVCATAVAADISANHPDQDVRDRARRRVDLFTPLAKAWPTDQGVLAASTALQVFGGMGFVEETGIAQRYRDIRIAPIYEGTNGIQAIDLVGRKVARDGGIAMGELLAEVDGTLAAAGAVPALSAAVESLGRAADSLRQATQWVVANPGSADVLAGATAYLALAASVAAGELMVRHALVGDDVDIARTTVFAAEHLDRVAPLATIQVGADLLAAGLGI